MFLLHFFVYKNILCVRACVRACVCVRARACVILNGNLIIYFSSIKSIKNFVGENKKLCNF